MLESAWESITDFFTKVYRFFVYGEYDISKNALYAILIGTCLVLFILSLSLKSGKGKPINSPILFFAAIALTIFTFSI